MYDKNLTKDLRLRLSEKDFNFLCELSKARAMNMSSCIRSIIGEYRRSLDTLSVLSEAINLAKYEKEEQMSYGDTEAYINYKL